MPTRMSWSTRGARLRGLLRCSELDKGLAPDCANRPALASDEGTAEAEVTSHRFIPEDWTQQGQAG